ncbi:MAG TPA: guanine permease [Sutterella sp.]|nr:guanine permease [Sutterella sp.]
MSFLNDYFHLAENGTNVRRECIAGLTTFLSMAYILAINPNILGNVMDASGVFVATAIASAFATFVMGLLANYPIVLSAGMGLNAYFAFSVCLGDLAGDPNAFRIGLTAVFLEGVVFIVLSLFSFRERIVNGIPIALKLGISGGIGLFIALIGLKGAGIVVPNQATLISLGDLSAAPVVLCLAGLLLIFILTSYRVTGAVLIGILLTWAFGMIAQVTGWYQGPNIFPDFSRGLQLDGITKTAFQFDFAWAATHITEFIAITLSFLYVDLFDTVGTVVGVADKAGLLDKHGYLPRVGRVFMSDALGTVAGACLGTSTVTSFVESSAGVAAGGRTGLTAMVAGVLFLCSLVLSPIFLAIPAFATAPALIFVGMLMVQSTTRIDFSGDYADVAGAFMAILLTPLTYSIANGIMFAIITWVILKVACGKSREVSPIMWTVFVLFGFRIISLVS